MSMSVCPNPAQPYRLLFLNKKDNTLSIKDLKCMCQYKITQTFLRQVVSSHEAGFCIVAVAKTSAQTPLGVLFGRIRSRRRKIHVDIDLVCSNQHMGKNLMLGLFDHVKTLWADVPKVFELHAIPSALGFYTKLGFDIREGAEIPMIYTMDEKFSRQVVNK